VEPTKVAIFLLFFGAFLVFTRRFFAGERPSNSVGFQPTPAPNSWESYQDQEQKQPAAIGSELPFPVELPPVQRLPSGRYNRPNVLNYYFSNLDLKLGPENPRSFCDQLFVQFEAPESGAVWTNEYVVATPFGLQSLLDTTGPSVQFEGTVIVVSRWDMTEILRTVLENVMDKYAESSN